MFMMERQGTRASATRISSVRMACAQYCGSCIASATRSYFEGSAASGVTASIRPGSASDRIAQVGAVPGEHRVRIIFEVNDDDDGRKRPAPVIHPRFTRFGESGLKCTVPMEGELILKVSR